MLNTALLKLLQINSIINSGSTGRIAEEIGQLVIANGWESYIAFGRNERESKSQKIKIGNTFDIYWHVLMTRIFDGHGLASVSATKNLVKQMEQIKPDIIHLHNIHGYFLNICVLFDYLSKVNIPIVWTLHDCWAFTGHCSHYDYVGCKKWITGCYACPQKGAYPASKRLDRSRRNYELKRQLFTSVKDMTIVPVSYWLGEQVKNSYLNKYPVRVIQNGIDIDLFSLKSNTESIKKKYNVQDKFVILGVASTWGARKGLNDFIVLNDLIDKNIYTVIMVGLSKKQIKALPKTIIAIERTENMAELACLYSAAGVFVNPTYEDTFPTTNLESLACGTPVITYRTGGSVESVSPDVGIIVEKGDIHGLLDAINHVAAKGKAVYSGNCRNHSVKNFRKEDRFTAYLRLYNENLQKN